MSKIHISVCLDYQLLIIEVSGTLDAYSMARVLELPFVLPIANTESIPFIYRGI